MPRHFPRLVLILLLLSAAGCANLAALQAPEIQLTSLRLLAPEQGSLDQRFAVGLRVTNPNNRSMTVDGLDFELDVNDKRLARGVSNEIFELPRLGETETTVVVTTSVLDLLRQAVDYAVRPDVPLNYRLRGRVHLGSGFIRSVPFDHRGSLMP